MRLILQCTTLVLHVLSAAGVGLRVANPHRRLEEDPPSSQLILSKEKYNFGEPISMDFINASPESRANAYPYIGIFHDKFGNTTLNEVPSFEGFIAWLNDCNSQNDCPSALTEGSVEFSAADPKEAYYYNYTYDYYGYEYEYTLGYGYFPFRDGKYVACFINDVYDVDATDDGAEAIGQELIADCERFHVRKPKKKMKKKAKVIAKRKIKFGNDFTATVKTPVPIPNQWVGIYKAEKGKAPKGPLDGKDLLWSYTACETQQGDQTETTNCNAKSKNSKVSLGEDYLNLENPKAAWPLKKGKYVMCVNFHANIPYNQYKCSKIIKVQ